MHKFFEAVGLFLLFLCAGSLWILLERCLPDGWPRSVSIVLLGGVFAGGFIWLLVSRLRKLFAGISPLARQLPLALLDLALLIGAFGVMYQRLGLMDNTTPGAPTTHALTTCLYYSVVTFTTLRKLHQPDAAQAFMGTGRL